jgi:hypothetical protein
MRCEKVELRIENLEGRGVYVLNDGGIIHFGARSLDCAPVLSVERTGAALGMTGGVEWRLI